MTKEIKTPAPQDLLLAVELDGVAEQLAEEYVDTEHKRNSSFVPVHNSGTTVPTAQPEIFTVGDRTMARVFAPAGLTNVHDLQAVLDAVEAALAPTAEILAWRTRHKNDGAHMWEYYPATTAKLRSETMVYQDLKLHQLLDILNDDRHANAQERPPEPHAPVDDASATEAMRLVVEYDNLLRQFTGPVADITESENAKIDAAYDEMVAAVRAALAAAAEGK